MEIHRYEKLWLGAALLLIVAFIATITYGAAAVGITMVSDSGGTVDPNTLGEDDRFGEPRVVRTGPESVEAYVVAQQFIFRPGEIVVPANTEVTMYVTSADVVHGLNVVGTNVNTMVIPGQVAEITFRTSEPQTYGIVCHEYCGQGHHDMEGLLRVVPESEFEASAVAPPADLRGDTRIEMVEIEDGGDDPSENDGHDGHDHSAHQHTVDDHRHSLVEVTH